MMCGLMMLVVQLGAVARVARRFGEVRLASAALALMGLSPAPLAAARSSATVFGAALGLESGAKIVGQIVGQEAR